MTATHAPETTVDANGNLFARNSPFEPWAYVGVAAEIAAAAAALGAPAAPEAEPEPVTVAVDEDDSRLGQLLAQYDLAKAEAKKAEEALKAITDGIKAELIAVAPDAKTIDVASKHLARALRLNAVTSTSVDSARLKVEQPLVFAQFSKSSTSWRLAQVG